MSRHHPDPLGLVVWFEDEPCRVEAAAVPIGWRLQPLREGLPAFRALRRLDGSWRRVGDSPRVAQVGRPR